MLTGSVARDQKGQGFFFGITIRLRSLLWNLSKPDPMGCPHEPALLIDAHGYQRIETDRRAVPVASTA